MRFASGDEEFKTLLLLSMLQDQNGGVQSIGESEVNCSANATATAYAVAEKTPSKMVVSSNLLKKSEICKVSIPVVAVPIPFVMHERNYQRIVPAFPPVSIERPTRSRAEGNTASARLDRHSTDGPREDKRRAANDTVSGDNKRHRCASAPFTSLPSVAPQNRQSAKEPISFHLSPIEWFRAQPPKLLEFGDTILPISMDEMLQSWDDGVGMRRAAEHEDNCWDPDADGSIRNQLQGHLRELYLVFQGVVRRTNLRRLVAKHLRKFDEYWTLSPTTMKLTWTKTPICVVFPAQDARKTARWPNDLGGEVRAFLRNFIQQLHDCSVSGAIDDDSFFNKFRLGLQLLQYFVNP